MLTHDPERGVAVVTGAASGIGRASARAFAEEGRLVVLADVDEEAGRATAAEIGAGARFVRADVSREEDVQKLFAAAAESGPLRAVHNNAGITMADSELHEVSIDFWDRLMSINLRGAWLVLSEAIRRMRATDGGAIVNTASVAALAAVPRRGPYSVSKAGILMLTRSAALENGEHGIRVNAVAPGPIVTQMALQAPPGGGELVGPPPSHRLGQPEEVAAAVVWLCSDAASYISGACLTVDGGWTTSLPARRREGEAG
jgi:NAD(P)-dependent dehydrogenase (short-subunit alcohol dehydrogenase family)